MAFLYWTGVPILLAAAFGAPDGVLVGLFAAGGAIAAGMFALIVYASLEALIAAWRLRARVRRVLVGFGLVRWRWWRDRRTGFVVEGGPLSVEVRLLVRRDFSPEQDALLRRVPELLAESDYRASGTDDLSFQVSRRSPGRRFVVRDGGDRQDG